MFILLMRFTHRTLWVRSETHLSFEQIPQFLLGDLFLTGLNKVAFSASGESLNYKSDTFTCLLVSK